MFGWGRDPLGVTARTRAGKDADPSPLDRTVIVRRVQNCSETRLGEQGNQRIEFVCFFRTEAKERRVHAFDIGDESSPLAHGLAWLVAPCVIGLRIPSRW